ncbi:response regulator [Methylobacterium oryzisoli]|uniref:response regulator n=1 Tax=Methylobacterium oryzisoli TaxID=3385502 RepID=UPI003891E5E8
MADPDASGLQGLCLLIVEDDWHIASDLAETLEGAGARVIGPVGSVKGALALIAAQARLDGAVLDINLADELVYPVADALAARRVPFVFATGYDAGVVPAAYATVTRHEKPVDLAALAADLARKARMG